MKSEFEVLLKLGEGAYSEVFKVWWKADNSIYAMKKVRMGSISEKEKANSLNEVWILAHLNHENIIHYKEAFIEDDFLCIVIEYADNLDLY